MQKKGKQLLSASLSLSLLMILVYRFIRVSLEKYDSVRLTSFQRIPLWQVKGPK